MRAPLRAFGLVQEAPDVAFPSGHLLHPIIPHERVLAIDPAETRRGARGIKPWSIGALGALVVVLLGLTAYQIITTLG